MSTFYTALCKSIRMGEQLGQEDIVIVFNLAIYGKAAEIIWKRQEEMNKVVIRMGAFHITCTLLAVIGKRFGDAGLADLMIESGIIGMGSVNGVLDGKQYNRAVRMNKILYEAFWRIRWESFCKWLENSRQVVDDDHITHVIQNFKDSISNGSLEILLEDPVISHLYQLEENFRDMDKGPMAEFWNSFLDIVSLLLCFIRSVRLGNWELHLFCIREMLPWIHIYDGVNYARYLPYYWIQMITLKDTHPQAYSELKNGAFAVQRQENSGFSQIAVDHTIEQTVNRDTKTKGGNTGFSLKKGAVERWFLTAHERAKICQNLYTMVLFN